MYFTRDPDKVKTASEGVRRAKSGRTAGTLAVGVSAVSDDGHQGAGRDRDAGKRAGESAARVSWISGRRRSPGRAHFRALAGAHGEDVEAGVEVRTAGGTISASRIVVATGYATREFRGLVGRFRMKDTYVLATRRLQRPPQASRDGVGHRSSVSLPAVDRRWAVAGRRGRHGAPHGQRDRDSASRRRATRLMTYLAQIYPELADEKPDYAWEGLFAETPDGLPYIGEHSRYPRHLFALGYGGNGMTASFLAAKTLVDLYQGATSAVKRGRSAICLPLTGRAGNLAPHFQPDPGSPSSQGGLHEEDSKFLRWRHHRGGHRRAGDRTVHITDRRSRAGERQREPGGHLRSRSHVAEAAAEQLGARIHGWSRHRRARSRVHRASRPVVARSEVREPDGVRASRASRRRRPRGRCSACRLAVSRRRAPATPWPATRPAT